MATVWLNGHFLDEREATVSLRDTGLLHAAGVFTTMRSYGGKVFRLDQHLVRLRKSCEALFVPLQFKDDALIAAVTELLQKEKLADARLRLTVTRGTARLDPLHGTHLEPTAFLTASALEPYPAEYYDRGMTVILLDEQKLNPYDIQAGHKTLNYFSRLSGLRAANQRAAGEALWFDVHNYLQSSTERLKHPDGRMWTGGMLQSGSISNVFIVERGKLITPPTNQELKDNPAIREAPSAVASAVLPGVTRAAVMELANVAGINIETAAIDVSRLLDAEEVFLTNSIMGVMPVCRIERHAVGNDLPGPSTRKLMQAYSEAVVRQ